MAPKNQVMVMVVFRRNLLHAEEPDFDGLGGSPGGGCETIGVVIGQTSAKPGPSGSMISTETRCLLVHSAVMAPEQD